ncbi:hypothetical protein BC941DRAFT_476237 [Chlamydoabsidia padenii]|nr:hypothetical protein BC941DRAFT_476237 [Chlamydoabsidia padenii]
MKLLLLAYIFTTLALLEVRATFINCYIEIYRGSTSGYQYVYSKNGDNISGDCFSTYFDALIASNRKCTFQSQKVEYHNQFDQARIHLVTVCESALGIIDRIKSKGVNCGSEYDGDSENGDEVDDGPDNDDAVYSTMHGEDSNVEWPRKLDVSRNGHDLVIECINEVFDEANLRLVPSLKSYDMCPEGCVIYKVGEDVCPNHNCKAYRYKDSNAIIKKPSMQIKVMSVSAMFSIKLRDTATWEAMYHRHNYTSDLTTMHDIYDGSSYKQAKLKYINKPSTLLLVYISTVLAFTEKENFHLP